MKVKLLQALVGRVDTHWSPAAGDEIEVADSVGALLCSLPVSRVYMAVRSGAEYDQSLVNTIIMLPMVVTAWTAAESMRSLKSVARSVVVNPAPTLACERFLKKK